MRPPPDVQSEQTRRVLAERSFAMRDARKKASHVAVCLIGFGERVPRYMGDNMGAWPVRVSTTSRPRDVAKKPDLESPLHKIVVLEMVWTPSDQHAKRLKAKLDELLLGSSSDSRLRHGWRHVDDPAVIWPILLGQAVESIRERDAFDLVTESERDNVVQMTARGRIFGGRK